MRPRLPAMLVAPGGLGLRLALVKSWRKLVTSTEGIRMSRRRRICGRLGDWDKRRSESKQRTLVRGSDRAQRDPVAGPPANPSGSGAPLELLRKTVDLCRHLIIQRRVRAARVVQVHGLIHRATRVLLALEFPPHAIFAFENAVHALGQGVLCTVIALGHTDAQAAIRQPIHVLMTTVLRAAIGVMNGVDARRQIAQRPLQSLETAFGLQSVSAMITDNF